MCGHIEPHLYVYASAAVRERVTFMTSVGINIIAHHSLTRPGKFHLACFFYITVPFNIVDLW